MGSHFERFVKKQIESGRYSNASEVVRDALQLLEEQEELREAQIKNFREKVQEGINSGPRVTAEEVFSRLEAKYAKLRPKS
ncbi:MAG: type II toxin-antitoxin system ParD family antitoxin [Desulfobaccales bacterium]